MAAATLALFSTAAAAATIWAPTNEDTDFIQFSFVEGISTNGGFLALADDDDPAFTNPLVIGQFGGEVRFTNNNDGTWKAEGFDLMGSLGFITLTNNRNFRLGMDWGGGYYGETMATPWSTPDSFLIIFDGFVDISRTQSISGNTLAVDLAPIPVPAAAWLFGSGLLGLIALSRRRA